MSKEGRPPDNQTTPQRTKANDHKNHFWTWFYLLFYLLDWFSKITNSQNIKVLLWGPIMANLLLEKWFQNRDRTNPKILWDFSPVITTNQIRRWLRDGGGNCCRDYRQIGRKMIGAQIIWWLAYWTHWVYWYRLLHSNDKIIGQRSYHLKFHIQARNSTETKPKHHNLSNEIM